jgi:hypothetical protein
MRTRSFVFSLGLAAGGLGHAHAGPTTAGPPGIANGFYAQLGTQALTQAGLESIEGYVDSLLDDPNAAYGFSYIVGCALPFQTKLVLEKDGKRVEFEGSLGLAPQWAEGACDLDCQEWVSACMLARTNAYGLPVYIYTDGPHPHLEAITREGRDGASVREGAFFGNLFQSPQEQYACRGDSRDPLALTWRVCTRPGNRCGIQALGACGDVDGETGAAVEEPVCEVNEKGLYTHCRSGNGPNAKVWERVITNFMRPTSFGGPRAESCGEPAPAAPPEQTPGDAGSPCLTNDGCGEDLICDTGWLGTGLCTRACDEEMDSEAQCGAGNTCLSIGADPRCTRACEHGTCSAGQVCTTLWLNLPIPDDPGCLPFCHADADCGEGTRCDTRFGTCGAGPAPDDFLEDGEPCQTNPDPAAAAEGIVYCKGSCFQIDDDPARGVCASLIDLSVHDDCLDRPDTMTPFQTTARDDLAICVYRNCRSNDECTAPLRCQRAGVAGGHCVY